MSNPLFLIELLVSLALPIMYISQACNTDQIKKLLKNQFYSQNLSKFKAIAYSRNEAQYPQAYLYLLEAVSYKLRQASPEE